jgi:hypothetical protein
MKIKTVAVSLLVSIPLAAACASPAKADTSLELLHGWNYNRDFNGVPERTITTIKTFQPWDYGTFFMYYDITGPFAPPDANVYPNEKGGFFGSISLTLSLKSVGQKITGKKWNWGGLDDFSLRTELEHVSKFGSLMYYGAQFNFKIPRFDFVTALASIRDDWNLKGVDLQLGMAWQLVIPLGDVTDIMFAGFFAWGLFGEGAGAFSIGPDQAGNFTHIPRVGRPFFLSQPQLLLDVGKLVRIGGRKVYAGLEYQIALNRYLQPGVHENVPQLMAKWNL